MAVVSSGALEDTDCYGTRSLRQLTGTLDEIRQSIKSDSKLPNEERDHLFSRLNRKPGSLFLPPVSVLSTLIIVSKRHNVKRAQVSENIS